MSNGRSSLGSEVCGLGALVLVMLTSLHDTVLLSQPVDVSKQRGYITAGVCREQSVESST